MVYTEIVTGMEFFCAVLQVGGWVVSAICRGQPIRAPSLDEAEVYAAVMGLNKMLHVQELFAWIGEPMALRLRMESSPTRSVLLPSWGRSRSTFQSESFVGSGPDTLGTCCWSRDVSEHTT